MRRLVALVLLTLAAASLSAQIPIAEPRLGLAPNNRWDLHAAASDEQYLLVWEDERGTPAYPRTWAARVSKAGAVVDPTGFPLDESVPGITSMRLEQSVASDGRDFLVAVTRKDAVRFIKVTRAGAVETAPDPAFTARYGRLAWLGDSYAYFFNEPQDDLYIKSGARVAILDRNGRVLVRPRTIVDTSWLVYDLQLTASEDGSRALLLWAQGGDVYSAPVSPAALRAGSVRITPGAPATTDPQVYTLGSASSSSRHFVAWLANDEIRGRVFDANGAPAGDSFRIAAARGWGSPSVTWNGSRFVVVYNHFDASVSEARLGVAEFSEDGQLLATPLRPATRVYVEPRSATLDGDTLVAWLPESGNDVNIRADIVRNSMFRHPANGILVSQSLPNSGYQKAVWLGDHYLALWTEITRTAAPVLGRLDRHGRPLDGSGHRIADALPLAGLASDGRDAVVLYLKRSSSPSGTLHSLHVAQDGTMTERSVETPDGDLAPLHTIWTGSEYAFCTNGLVGRVAADGTILQVDKLENPVDDCQIAWTGSQYIVSGINSEFCFPSCIPPTVVRAQSYTRHLVPVGTPATLTDTDASQAHRLAAAGDRTLLVWLTRGGKLRGLRVAKSGFVLDPINGFEIGTAKSLGEVYADGENWVVGSGPYTWTVSRDGTVSARVTKYSFVPELSYAITVRGGPAPLVLYNTQPGGAEQSYRLVGRFVIPARGRVVRR